MSTQLSRQLLRCYLSLASPAKGKCDPIKCVASQSSLPSKTPFIFTCMSDKFEDESDNTTLEILGKLHYCKVVVNIFIFSHEHHIQTSIGGEKKHNYLPANDLHTRRARRHAADVPGMTQERRLLFEERKNL